MHLSDIRHYERCHKLLWLSEYEPITFEPFVYFNGSLSDMIKQYFEFTTYYEGNVGDDNDKAMKALKTYDVLINARFESHDLRVKIPLMMKQDDGWILYFSYANCYPKESEAQKLADTITVLETLEIKVCDVNIIHLNYDYIRGKTLDVKQLLVVTPYLYNKKNHPHHLAMTLIEKRKRNVFALCEKAKDVLQGECPTVKEGPNCMKGRKCRYFDHCFPMKTCDTSILNLMQTAHKYDLIEQGYDDMKNVDVDLLEGTRQQYAQIMAAKNNGFYMDYFAVKGWLKQVLHYPLSYLDFEWETFVYPPYENMRAFDVLVFQYSLHVEENEDGKLRHEEFIGQGDCRIAFIEHLLAHIPPRGTIFVYNMEGAEKLRLRQLGIQFPQYQEVLNALCERMVDLSLPFEAGNIYDSRMRNYYSLKKLIEVFSDYDYRTLDISQGLQAARSWRMMEDAEDDAQHIRKALSKYCAMDTYAEYIIVHKIMALLNEYQPDVKTARKRG